jgi:hypothetical protein
MSRAQIVILLHIIVSLYYIVRWFIPMVTLAWRVRKFKLEEVLACMSDTEAKFIQWGMANIPKDEHILWLVQADPIVTYYLYPRRSYHQISADNATAIQRRGIKWVVTKFEYNKVEIKRLK